MTSDVSIDTIADKLMVRGQKADAYNRRREARSEKRKTTEEELAAKPEPHTKKELTEKMNNFEETKEMINFSIAAKPIEEKEGEKESTRVPEKIERKRKRHFVFLLVNFDSGLKKKIKKSKNLKRRENTRENRRVTQTDGTTHTDRTEHRP